MISTTSNNYVDTGLVNGKTYCYYIKSTGSYSTSGIVNPIVNYSQIACDEPEDLTPPCNPTIFADPDCETYSLTLTWNNPNNSCINSVSKCQIPNSTYELLTIPKHSVIQIKNIGSGYIQGDINSDGIINIIDIIDVVNAILDQSYNNPLLDVNNDGIVNIVDIIDIVNFILDN